MEVLLGGETVDLVGNPPEVGEQLPKFKLFDADGQKLKRVIYLEKQLSLV